MNSTQWITEVPELPARQKDGHKGTYGKVLVVAGSRGMSGAAILCASAALRGGAGLVQVATPAEITRIVATGNPCYTTWALPNDATGKFMDTSAIEIISHSHSADVVAIGPGLGQSDHVTAFVGLIFQRVHLPMVVDADGLNALQSFRKELWHRKDPTILTPHPGEFARLLGCSTAAVQSNREKLAFHFAQERKLILVLKGEGTLVTDGHRMYRNTSGNPGMATGGTGDVLTGIIASLLAQRLDPLDAAMIGVYVHGLAGDFAARHWGEISLTALDLLDYLPNAFEQVTEKRTS